MAQPLPDWLRPVTLRYQDSDIFTTGLVQLPIPYQGPSIPIEWPFTSIQPSAALPTSFPSQSLTYSPSSLQTITFYNGDGPFTVSQGLILTSPPAPSTSPAPNSISQTQTSPSTTSQLVVLTTLIVNHPSTNFPSPISENPLGGSYNSLVTGFIILLLILFVLIIGILIVLIRRQRIFKAHRHLLDGQSSPIDYPFNSQLLPQHHHGSQTHQSQLEALRNQHAWTTSNNQGLVQNPILEKDFTQPQLDPLLPFQKTSPHLSNRWDKCKNALITLIKPFRTDKTVRARTAYDHLAQSAPNRSKNPYHDPSVSTATCERVSRWRIACESPSSSVVYVLGTIKSSQNSHHKKLNQIGNNDFIPDLSKFGSSLSKGKNIKKQIKPTLNNLSSLPASVPNPENLMALDQQQPIISSSKQKLKPTIESLLQLSAFRGFTSKQSSYQPKESLLKGSFIKSSIHIPQSLKTKPSHSTKKGSSLKRYSEDSPPLLLETAQDQVSESDATDEGDSPLDFITLPLRSPPQSRKAISGSHQANQNHSFDLIGLSTSTTHSSSTPPLVSPLKPVRRKKHSGPIASGTDLDSRPSHSLLLNSSIDIPSDNTEKALPKQLPVLPLTANRPLASKKKTQHQIGFIHSSNNQVHQTRHNSIESGSSLETNLSRSGHTSGLLNKSIVSSSLLFPIPPTSSRVILNDKNSDQIIPINPEATTLKTASQRTASSASDEDILFTGYGGSAPIGNTGGVSELGILEPHPSSGHLVSLSSPPCLNSSQAEFHQTQNIEPTERALITSIEQSKADDLFYVKPKQAYASGSQWTLGQRLEFGRIGSSIGEERSEAIQLVPPILSPSSTTASLNSGFVNSTSSHEISENRSNSSSTEGENPDKKSDVILSYQVINNPYVPFSLSSNYPLAQNDHVGHRVNRSVSSSFLGSIFSLGQDRRSGSSSPSGTPRAVKSVEGNDGVDFRPMLNERSPLQRIAEKARRHPKSKENLTQISNESKNSKREDEHVVESKLSSKYSFATLGRRLDVQTDVKEVRANNHNTSIILNPNNSVEGINSSKSYVSSEKATISDGSLATYPQEISQAASSHNTTNTSQTSINQRDLTQTDDVGDV